MKFSEPIKVPKFKDSESRRQMEEAFSLSEIDVTRDVVDFDFGQKASD